VLWAGPASLGRRCDKLQAAARAAGDCRRCRRARGPRRSRHCGAAHRRVLLGDDARVRHAERAQQQRDIGWPEREVLALGALWGLGTKTRGGVYSWEGPPGSQAAHAGKLLHSALRLWALCARASGADGAAAPLPATALSRGGRPLVQLTAPYLHCHVFKRQPALVPHDDRRRDIVDVHRLPMAQAKRRRGGTTGRHGRYQGAITHDSLHCELRQLQPAAPTTQVPCPPADS
jgi:hypothetical protein